MGGETFERRPGLSLNSSLFLKSAQNGNMIISLLVPHSLPPHSALVSEKYCPVSFSSPKNDSDDIIASSVFNLICKKKKKLKLRISRSPQVQNKCVKCLWRPCLERRQRGQFRWGGIWYMGLVTQWYCASASLGNQAGHLIPLLKEELKHEPLPEEMIWVPRYYLSLCSRVIFVGS